MDRKDEGQLEGADAQREVELERDRIARIAGELKRRAAPDYVTGQARTAVIKKTTDLKNRAIRSPIVLGITGAALGMAASRIIRAMTAKTKKERIEWEPLPDSRPADMATGIVDETRGKTAQLGDKAADVKDTAVDKVTELKDKAVSKAAELKDKAVDVTHQVKDKAAAFVDEARTKIPVVADDVKHAGERAYHYATDEQPALGGLLALGVGALLGFLLPVSDKEEELLAPLKEKAAKNLGELENKVGELGEKLGDKISGEREETKVSQRTDDLPPLH